MTDCHSSNVARNRSFRVQVDDTVDDERPPRGRDQGHAAVHLEGRTVTPVIQENLDRPVTAGHLENVLNDFQARMAAVMEEQIKNNMLFFQMSPGGEAAAPLKGRSQEGRPGPSRPPRPELTRPPSKGKQPAVSDSRRKMDWKLVVRPADNIPPTGHMMETDAREYLEAKRAAAQQRSASGSTPYMKDPSLRLPSRTVARCRGPSAFQPRQEKTVLQPIVGERSEDSSLPLTMALNLRTPFLLSHSYCPFLSPPCNSHHKSMFLLLLRNNIEPSSSFLAFWNSSAIFVSVRASASETRNDVADDEEGEKLVLDDELISRASSLKDASEVLQLISDNKNGGKGGRSWDTVLQFLP
ncbi:hypothetical protein BVRB_5g106790 [Beta vulgaris subsp. vulgaris]|nr:hypothetical protein BVRB_5g106790 [Beta vulgaris subsp. vulgaris]